MLEVTFLSLKQTNQKLMGSVGFHLQFPAVQAEKDVGCKKGNTLVSIDKGVIHQERLKEGGRHFSKVLVITSPGTKKRAFKKPEIADPFQD